MFKHFLITRFNLKVDGWETTKNKELLLSRDWLHHRFDLFESYCLPSVQNQTNQKFIWYVFFNSDTPIEYVARINSISCRYDRLRPIFIDGRKHLNITLLSSINADISSDDKYIITSRLDNDDGLHMSFVDTVQNCFTMQNSCIIDIVDGYQLILDELNNKNKVGMISDKFNPFISLIESSKNPKTVISRMHHHWSDSGKVISIQGKRLWFQVIHGKNKLNFKDRTFILTNSFPKDEFGLNDIFLPISPLWKLLFYNLKSRTKLLVRYPFVYVKRILYGWP